MGRSEEEKVALREEVVERGRMPKGQGEVRVADTATRVWLIGDGRIEGMIKKSREEEKENQRLWATYQG